MQEVLENAKLIVSKKIEKYSQTRQFPARSFPGPDLPCIKYLLAGVKEGMRNGAAFTLACYFKNQGDCEHAVVERLVSWNEGNLPPLEPFEILSIVKSVFENEYKIGCSSPMLEMFCDEEKCPLRSSH
jgi:DNA primase large subunit